MTHALFTTHKLVSLDDTKTFARNLAKIARPHDVFCLDGPLGTGKTAFARFFIQACAEEEIEVPSPTFTLLQTYETPKGSVWHFDVYRLKDSEEIFEVGLEESLAYGITIIEWAHKIEPYLPSNRLHLKFEINAVGERFLTIQPHGPSSKSWLERVG
jgi:tRNA threonylcarbamoyl adenosine modification protein YjeE